MESITSAVPMIVTAGSKGKLIGLFRLRYELPKQLSRKKYPHLLNIVWEYKTKKADGLPERHDSIRMEEFEKRLTPALEESKLAYLIGGMLADHSSEWFYYIENLAKTQDMINLALSGCERYPVTMNIAADPEWKRYEALKKQVGLRR